MILTAAWGVVWIWAAVPQGSPTEGWPTDLAQASPPAPAAPAATERRTPDLVLLRVQTNFLEHDLRLDSTYQDRITGTPARSATDFDIRLAVPVDTVWMIGVIGNYRWLEEVNRPNENGAAVSVFGRVQMIEEVESSYAFTLEISSPNKGVENDRTQVSAGVAGFEDLDALLGFDGVGLYADLQLQHSTSRGQVDGGNQLAYVVSMAKTWTGDLLGTARLSVFEELGGTTQIDQGSGGRTTLSITPGFRFDPSPAHAFLAGVDFPLTHPHGFGELFRISYIYSF